MKQKEKWIYPYVVLGNNSLISLFVMKTYIMLIALIVLSMKAWGHLDGLANRDILNLIMVDIQLSLCLAIVFALSIAGKLLWNIGVWFYERRKKREK